MGANLGVTPMNDGRLVRVPIPELSEERRIEMTKVAKRTAEEARVAVRNVRREGNDLVKALQKDGKVTEDDREAALKEIQTLTDKFVGIVDDMMKAKEADVMTV